MSSSIEGPKYFSEALPGEKNQHKSQNSTVATCKANLNMDLSPRGYFTDFAKTRLIWLNSA